MEFTLAVPYRRSSPITIEISHCQVRGKELSPQIMCSHFDYRFRNYSQKCLEVREVSGVVRGLYCSSTTLIIRYIIPRIPAVESVHAIHMFLSSLQSLASDRNYPTYGTKSNWVKYYSQCKCVVSCDANGYTVAYIKCVCQSRKKHFTSSQTKLNPLEDQIMTMSHTLTMQGHIYANNIFTVKVSLHAQQSQAYIAQQS